MRGEIKHINKEASLGVVSDKKGIEYFFAVYGRHYLVGEEGAEVLFDLDYLGDVLIAVNVKLIENP